MSVGLYENEVRRVQRELETQREKQAEHERKAASAEQDALRYERDASRASSSTSATSKLRQAEGKRVEANKARQAAANASHAYAKAQKKLFEAQKKLTAARAAEATKAADKERRDQERHERRRAEEERRRERELQDVDRRRQHEMQRLRSETDQLQQQLARIPSISASDEVTVLFIAASPEDQEPLRLDREVREIQQRVRASEHRDSVRFEYRLASQLTDLLQMLNEVRPEIVHFSGHGSQHALVFENDDGVTRPLPNELLAGLLKTSSDRIRLALFNSCESSSQAELASFYIDAAIGMDLPVGDEAAKVFAGQFYNSLGFGRSLQDAFDQACLHVELATGELSGSPKLYTAPDIEADELVLVAPPDNATRAA